MENVLIKMYKLEEIKNKIFCGDSNEVLKNFPSNSIDLIITSPPYYFLRDYQHRNQVGREETVTEYIDNLICIFKECKRVMKSTASLYINISDSYDKHKSLRGVPERLRLRLQDELDFKLRNTIIWKKNGLPESPNDRYSNNFEYLYFFTKSEKYYFKIQYQPYADSTLKQLNQIYLGKGKKDYEANGVQNPSDLKRKVITSIQFGGKKYPNQIDNNTYSGNAWEAKPEGARKKCVWDISTGNSIESHFASYPEELIHTPIDASCPPSGLVLDPFLGSGTTAIKAQKMGRNYAGIELNHKYVLITKRRLNTMIDSYLIRE